MGQKLKNKWDRNGRRNRTEYMKQERNNKWDRVREQMEQGYKNREKRREGN